MQEMIVHPTHRDGTFLSKREVLEFEGDMKRIFGGSKHYKTQGCRHARGVFTQEAYYRFSEDLGIVAVNFQRKGESRVAGEFIIVGYEDEDSLETYRFNVSAEEFGSFTARVFGMESDKMIKRVRSWAKRVN